MDNKERWERRYASSSHIPALCATLESYYHLAPIGRALDIACGVGQNSLFLAQKGFLVDAVDFAKSAIDRIPPHPNIMPILSDMNDFSMGEGRYDLILCANYLERSLFEPIKRALKPGGIVIFETFTYKKQGMNPRYLLGPNELLKAFLDLEVLHYELKGERAAIVAKK